MSLTLKNKCRTCLKPSSMLRLLSTKPKMLKIDKTYTELLKFVCNIEVIDGDNGEQQGGICCNCCRRIRDSYTFIKQVRECNKQFMTVDSKASLANDEKCTMIENVQLSFIKQEVDKYGENFNLPKVEMGGDTCSSISNDNFQHFPAELNYTEAHKLANKDVEIKIETEQLNEMVELHPVCVLNETAFVEENIKTDNDSDKLKDIKKYDQVDSNEISVVQKSMAVDDKFLPVCCEECERVFPNSILLNRHKKDTHIPDEMKIQCPSCPVKFSRRYNMYAHMRTFHKTETVREHQIQPRKLANTYVCDQCNLAYSEKNKLMAHIKSKHGPDSKPKKEKQNLKRYLCTLCGLTYSSQSKLDLHYRRHTGEKPFKCDFCDRAYARMYDVQVHRRTHTGEKPFKCTVCEKAFKRSNKLKIHMRTHTNERPYKCAQCEKAFKQSRDLNIHKRTHTGERPYKCGVCQSTFTQINSLKLHKKTKHPELSNQEAEFTDITKT